MAPCSSNHGHISSKWYVLMFGQWLFTQKNHYSLVICTGRLVAGVSGTWEYITSLGVVFTWLTSPLLFVLKLDVLFTIWAWKLWNCKYCDEVNKAMKHNLSGTLPFWYSHKNITLNKMKTHQHPPQMVYCHNVILS